MKAHKAEKIIRNLAECNTRIRCQLPNTKKQQITDAASPMSTTTNNIWNTDYSPPNYSLYI